MTIAELNALQNRLVQRKDMSNIEKLARLIVATGHADQIMASLELALSSGFIHNTTEEEASQ